MILDDIRSEIRAMCQCISSTSLNFILASSPVCGLVRSADHSSQTALGNSFVTDVGGAKSTSRPVHAADFNRRQLTQNAKIRGQSNVRRRQIGIGLAANYATAGKVCVVVVGRDFLWWRIDRGLTFRLQCVV